MSPSGPFTIQSVDAREMSTARFVDSYFAPEVPVVIRGVATRWPARAKWSVENMRAALTESSTVVRRPSWYESGPDFAADDIVAPEFVTTVLAPTYSYLREHHCRFWIHRPGAVTPWHVDAQSLYVIHVQVHGRKQWSIVSPQTPLTVYPFDTFAMPFDVATPRPETVHAVFTVEEGDLLFLPPHWFHRVLTLDDSVTFNWVGTKRQSGVASAQATREAEILKLVMMGGTPFIRALNKRSVLAIPHFFDNYGACGPALVAERASSVTRSAALRRAAKELRNAVRVTRRLPLITGPDGFQRRRYEASAIGAFMPRPGGPPARGAQQAGIQTRR